MVDFGKYDDDEMDVMNIQHYCYPYYLETKIMIKIELRVVPYYYIL